MNITYPKPFKSFQRFEWIDVPAFGVVTGPNGTGKSQLLELIERAIQHKQYVTSPLKPGDHLRIPSEWNCLVEVEPVGLAELQQHLSHFWYAFEQFRSGGESSTTWVTTYVKSVA